MTAQSYPGVWRPGDEPGRRQFAVLTGEGGRGFPLEGGGRLDEVTVADVAEGKLPKEIMALTKAEEAWAAR